MKHVVRSLVVLALAVAVASPIFAADKKKEEGKKKKPAASAMVLKQAMNRFKKVELSDEQKAKIEKLAADWAPKVAEARKAANLKPEQMKARREAMAKAKADGLKGKEAAKAVAAALNLSDEQQATMKKAAGVMKEFNAAVMGVLTDEQKAKLGGKRKGGKAKPKAEN
ncbi:MAG: Spy/CpxP family protein refolding chaperone [bacterium]|nr:Spy/CpxP family protein refolding chaperone [bacterium]